MVWLGIKYRKASRFIKRFVREYKKNRDSLTLRDVFDFYDELVKYITYFTLSGKDGADYLMLIGTDLIDAIEETSDEFVFVPPMLPIEACYIYVSGLGSPVIEKVEYVVSNSKDPINHMISQTINVLNNKSVEEAAIVSSGILLYGLASFFEKNVEGGFMSIQYFSTLLNILNSPREMAFSLVAYISLVLLIELYASDEEFSSGIEERGDKYFRDTYVARMIFNEEGRGIEDYIRDLLRYMQVSKDKSFIVREFIAFRWYYNKFSEMYPDKVGIISKIMSALARILYSEDEAYLRMTEKFYDENRIENLSEYELESILAAALKLYDLGLKESFKNIVEYIRRIGEASRDRDSIFVSKILATLEEADER